MTIFVTSDLHIGHKNILKYTDRHKVYKDIEDHDNQIIDTINKIVKNSDILYLLGDIAMFNIHSFISKLNGSKIIIPGNHDKWRNNSHTSYLELKYNDDLFIMCHYPLLQWNKGHYGSYMLHGHCHGGINSSNENLRRIDVGWDNFYRPISLQEIVRLKQDCKPHEHHD